MNDISYTKSLLSTYDLLKTIKTYPNSLLIFFEHTCHFYATPKPYQFIRLLSLPYLFFF